MDEVSKILTPKKKDQSADKKHASEICKFPLYPSEISQRSKDADRLNPSERLWSHPSKNFIQRGGGGGDIKWNGPFIAQHFKNSNISKIHLCYESKQCAQEQFSLHTLQQRCPG
jgi:hypothetical protein